MNLTINRTDGTTQVISLSPSFFPTEVQGNGKNKKVYTAKEKAYDLALDIAGNQYKSHSLNSTNDY